MLKEQKKNKIIGIIVILVVFGVLFYIKMSKQSDEPEANIAEEQSEVSEQESASGEVTENIQNLTVNTAGTKDVKKFNSLLEAGNKAFYAKDYQGAIKIFKEALVTEDSDFIYSRLHGSYAAMGDKVQAVKMIDVAISKNPLFTEHWITKLVYLEEKTSTSFVELKQIYTDGLSKVDSRTKPNLVTTFARIAEANGMKDEAIATWTKAIEIYPTNKAIYQAEIDRLKAN